MATDKKKQVIYLPLEDVESKHCALIVEKGLARLKSIETHQVEMNNRRAVITVDNTQAVAEAIKAIKDLGYGVSTVKNTFPVLGMTCASCAGSAESIVTYEPGVVSAAVNFATGNLTVEYLPNMTDAAKLQKAVHSRTVILSNKFSSLLIFWIKLAFFFPSTKTSEVSSPKLM
jgi:Cu2+-exporting ATPase